MLLGSAMVQGQELNYLDSLRTVFRTQPEMRKNPELLLSIASEVKFPDSAIYYSHLALEVLDSNSSKQLLQRAYKIQGANWRLIGEYEKSLDYLFKSIAIAESLNDPLLLGATNVEIGNTYSESGNFIYSATYFDRGLDYLRKAEDTLFLGMALYNVGDGLFDKGELDSSLVYTQEAREIFKKYNRDLYEAYSLGNLGRIYAGKGDSRRGESYLNQAISILEEVKDYNAITDFLFSMAEVQFDRENYDLAIEYAERSLKAAETHELKRDLENVHLLLSTLYERSGNIPQAFDHFKQYVIYKDSIRNIKSIEEMANLRSDFEIAQKQIEVDLLSEREANQRNVVIAVSVALFLIALLAFGLYRRNKHIGRTKKVIEREKSRSDLLLLNILPQETAMELKEQGKVKAKRFEAVTVLFTDFQNFTHFSENLSPEELVKSVDFYFSKFDEIVEQHGLEKIKTVGDAYMCAAGVPFPVEDHAERMLSAACDMLAFVKEAKELKTEKETRFDVRIGINSGPVVAGVVGRKKWAYDIWGDAVNIAARMESCSQSGEINISENTYELIKDKFHCHYRGEIMVKNKGMMKMYFVKGRKHETQVNVA